MLLQEQHGQRATSWAPFMYDEMESSSGRTTEVSQEQSGHAGFALRLHKMAPPLPTFMPERMECSSGRREKSFLSRSFSNCAYMTMAALPCRQVYKR